MKTTYSNIFILFMVIFLAACASEEGQLSGVWRVEDVEMEADDAKISQQEIDRIEEMQKSVHFQIKKDHEMNIITAGDTFRANWSLYNGDLYMKLEGASLNDSTKIGRFEEGLIISRDKTPAGWVTITYKKD